MAHLSSTTVELEGVKARVIIEQSDDHEDYVRVTLCIEPPMPAQGEYPYSAVIKKPAKRRTPVFANPCREVLRGRGPKCNGGGYDGCACGTYSGADHHTIAENAL